MKKILATFLSIAISLSMTGCTPEPEMTPEELFDMVMNEQEEITTADLNYQLIFNVNDPSVSETVEGVMEMDVLMDVTEVSDPRFDATVSVSSMGVKLTMDIFYHDGYQYMNMFGQKTKQKTNPEILQQLFTSDMGTYMIHSTDLETLEMTESNGNKTLAYTISEEKTDILFAPVYEIFDEIFSAEELQGMGELIDIDIGNLSGSVVVDENNKLSNVAFNLTMDMTNGAETAEFEMEALITINSYNEPIKIEIPPTDEYEEIPPDSNLI